MTSKEIRASFLAFFEKHGHRIVAGLAARAARGPDAPLHQRRHEPVQGRASSERRRASYTRATTAQKCMRVSGKHNDLDNVGPSFRHHTFFEMLGNFSFGDYFKREAIPFAWTLLTDVWQIPKDRLVRHDLQGRRRPCLATTRRIDVWRSFLPADRISELGSRRQLLDDGRHRAVRPLLRDLLLPRGAPAVRRGGGRPALPRRRVQTATATSRSGTTCSWSSTGRPTARLNPLPAPSIDTGMGLERVTAVLQGRLSNYDTDLFTPILAAIGERAGTTHRGTMDAVRRLDARRRGPPACDDVPHRRRRGAVERVARLRPAQDHAARDAARQTARPGRAVSLHVGRHRGPRIRRRVSRAQDRPRHRRYR